MKVCTGKTNSPTHTNITPWTDSHLFLSSPFYEGETFLGSASPPLHFCQTKCLTSAILQHMLDVNIMSPCLALEKKNYKGKKKGRKNVLISWMSFQYCSCSHFLFRILWNKCWISQESKNALWFLPGVQQAGKICGLQQRQNRVQCSNAWCCHSYSPSKDAKGCPSKCPSDLYRFSLELLDSVCLHLEHSGRPRGAFMGSFPSSCCTELTYFCPVELPFWHFSKHQA